MDTLKKKIEEVINKETNSLKDNRERKLVMYTGCKTYGLINIMEKRCSDPECVSCSRFTEALKKESDNWIFYEQN